MFATIDLEILILIPGIKKMKKQQGGDLDISKILTMKRKGENPKMTELTPGTRLYQLAKDFDKFM